MYGQFFVLFAILFTGYVLRKTNFIDDDMNAGMNRFIIYFAYPCLLVYSIGTMDMTRKLVIEFIVMLVASTLFFFIYGLYTYLYTKKRHFAVENANVAELSIVAPNNGFMGFPIAMVFLGQAGLFLMMANNAAMNIYFFSYGMHVLRRNDVERRKPTFKSVSLVILKVILNPNISALIIGFVLCYFKVPLDNAVGSYLNTLGNVATPMAMIFIGSTLAGSHFLEMLKEKAVWESTVNKLVILPIFTALVCLVLPIGVESKAILILSACLPSAATTAMLAEQEGQNQEMASKILFFTTVLSMGTLPIGTMLINMFFL